jgi:hypothetical protein
MELTVLMAERKHNTGSRIEKEKDQRDREKESKSASNQKKKIGF